MQVRVKENNIQFGNCGCGRSPTGKCIGWHGLDAKQLAEAQHRWELEQYRKKMTEQFFEDGSCTGGEIKKD